MADPTEPNPSVGALSRRAFLRGAGLTAAASVAGSALAENGLLGARPAHAADALEHGPLASSIELDVNGTLRRVEVEPRTSLAEVLRGPLHLTGTKVVCDRGACSACTVWLDGTPVNSCMTFALDARGKKITTIEGLAKLASNGEGDLHPVQAAFVAADALQCGYCTPGMVMSCAALLAKNPDPTLDDVRHAVRGNLCRCGTYPKVFEATLAAAQTMRDGRKNREGKTR